MSPPLQPFPHMQLSAAGLFSTMKHVSIGQLAKIRIRLLISKPYSSGDEVLKCKCRVEVHLFFPWGVILSFALGR